MSYDHACTYNTLRRSHAHSRTVRSDHPAVADHQATHLRRCDRGAGRRDHLATGARSRCRHARHVGRQPELDDGYRSIGDSHIGGRFAGRLGDAHGSRTARAFDSRLENPCRDQLHRILGTRDSDGTPTHTTTKAVLVAMHAIVTAIIITELPGTLSDQPNCQPR